MFYPFRSVDVTLKAVNVNNKRIMREVDNYVMNGVKATVRDLRDEQEQQGLAMLIEDVLHDFAASENLLDQVHVICDRRNNPKEERDAKRVHFTVKYQQKNCLNITELHYIFDLS
jgi:hypothetical protein